jgi:hypothetical protein
MASINIFNDIGTEKIMTQETNMIDTGTANRVLTPPLNEPRK